MYLIVGLGNPGHEYFDTKHNVGFLTVDHMAEQLEFPAYKDKFDSLYAEKKLHGTQYSVILQKPQTYMNRSGSAVVKLLTYYKISPEDTYVIHDDIDLEPLDIRVKFSGGSGGHNGIRSIDSMIGPKYWRIRVGVGRPVSREYDVSDYVLSKFDSVALAALERRVFCPISENIVRLLTSEDKRAVARSMMLDKTC
ncbi:MAG: aminoacyl-tRNA hydrolase [Holosporales bacterium]|jgi:PTH1 family peptidyl-tRNA hydrolase|nr:aminoacyl-tRNA hydrolase [Holosporales bacterium]